MSSNVEIIKERLGIDEVIGSYIKLEKSGLNFKAKCPFHSEKSASFFVSPDRGTYYCFGCNTKGDIFTFIQEFEGLDFLGALKVLASRAGISLEFEKTSGKNNKDRLFELLETAVKFFEENLVKNQTALDYLSKRGVKKETLKDWRLGFAPLEWQSLVNYCRGKGFTDSELIKTGLAKEAPNKENRLYDVFRGRVMFPIFDNAERVIAFSGRLLADENSSINSGQVNSPKYLNSPETEFFNKSEILYGFNQARFEIRKKNYSILVEGQMDLVLSHQLGFKNTVSTSGTALAITQLEKLNRLSPRIVLAYDGDSAGFRALEKGAKLALSLGMNVGIASLPKGEDPASIILKDPKIWSEILKKSKHIIDFYIEKILSTDMDGRQIDHQIKKRVLPFIKLLPSNIEQARFISEISYKAGIKESAIWEDLKNLPEDSDFKNDIETVLKDHPEDRKILIIKQLSGILFWQEVIGSESLIDTSKLKDRLIQVTEENSLEKLKGGRDELIFEAEAYFKGQSDINEVVEDLFLNLEEEILKEKFAKVMKNLSIMEKKNDKENTSLLLEECREISQKINELNSKKLKIFPK